MVLIQYGSKRPNVEIEEADHPRNPKSEVPQKVLFEPLRTRDKMPKKKKKEMSK